MKINLQKREVLTYYASEKDQGSPTDFEIYNNGIPYAPTSARIRGKKPSGATFDEACEVSGNTVTVTTTASMTDEAGRFPVELRLVEGQTITGTINFDFWVERDPEEGGVT